ncbi:hypothetical protein PV08_03774 [Exophiala spinifera]|uniref:MARVEL domain-containing protein n=1 Tax=Exophiala spinifera TaxID=91928 RepID=A0A0D1YNE0_9EURO|nr:uncharacterized protein PV08_03774 [Exophiala spinifera]KIW16586.1 hypothetical protein PV08_03774 [Exophiala spinifera]
MVAFLHNLRKSNLLNLFFRTLQLVQGLVVIGLYGVDLNRANREHKYSDGKWVFAVVVGSLAAFTAVAYGLVSVFLQYQTVARLFVWDWILFILWAALSGIFGSMYIGEKTEMEWGIHRMKIAVGFDLAGLVLWFITAVMGTWWIFSQRRVAGRVSGGKD